jgi:hypothetical protein
VVAEGIAELPDDTVIDGEIVALDDNGRASLQPPTDLRDTVSVASCSCDNPSQVELC